MAGKVPLSVVRRHTLLSERPTRLPERALNRPFTRWRFGLVSMPGAGLPPPSERSVRATRHPSEVREETFGQRAGAVGDPRRTEDNGLPERALAIPCARRIPLGTVRCAGRVHAGRVVVPGLLGRRL